MCSTIYPTLCLIIALFRGVVVCAGSDYLEQRGLQGVSHSSTQELPNPVLRNVLAEAHKALARRGNGRTCSTSTSATTAKKSTTTAKTTSTSKSTTTSTTKSIATTTTTSAIPTPTGTSPWAVSHQYLGGSNFFTGWDFFVDSDPTNGIVDYVDQTTASASGLISAKNGVTIIGVDTTAKVTGNRNSVRIQTQATYSGGLVIMDSSHMPTGCGTWSAFWSYGLSWPYEGEIDIVEGLNNYTVNQATLHTNTGCTLPSSNPTSLGATGSLTGSTNCSTWDNYNAGCGFLDTRTTSFGPGFNSNGGGVYAMLWADTGISVYFFSRGSVPSDITSGAPQPAYWGTPVGHWPASSCSPSTFFKDHSLIFDTTLCGDWGNAVWNSSDTPGQEQSCASRTGYSTCEEYVRNKGGDLSETYWAINSVTIYKLKGA